VPTPAAQGTPGYASILAFTKNDEVAAEELRRTLVALRDHLPDRHLARTFGDVLAGRLTFREMSRRPDVQAAMANGIETFSARYDAMAADERETLLAAGRASEREIRADLDR
jgi:hypothetical protein